MLVWMAQVQRREPQAEAMLKVMFLVLEPSVMLGATI
jgi:hypothetical protein